MGDGGSRIPAKRATRVLVADGDRAFALFARYVLRQVGCEVDMAESTDDALALIRDRSLFYSAVVVDPVFADNEGVSICGRLYDLRPEAAHVLVSEAAEPETGRHDAWLRKPYQPVALVQAVTAGIEARAIRRRAEIVAPVSAAIAAR